MKAMFALAHQLLAQEVPVVRIIAPDGIDIFVGSVSAEYSFRRGITSARISSHPARPLPA
ncbi:MAG: hypothetical protein R3E01_31145 [Pirellulaceae bacterium]|nr:hypothetical protein [Planctomycetales bacterium]